jgi:hypothetical protein
MTIADVLNEPIESPFNTFTSVKRTNPKLKIEIWRCIGDKDHLAGGFHWIIKAHAHINEKTGDAGFWYEVNSGLELTIEQAGSISFQEYKVLLERL